MQPVLRGCGGCFDRDHASGGAYLDLLLEDSNRSYLKG